MHLKLLLRNLLGLVFLSLASSCALTEVPEFEGHIINPYNQTCYGVNVLTLEDGELPLEACYRGVILFSEDYAKIKSAFYKNCTKANNTLLGKQCRQSVQVLDELFLTIDKAVAEVYGDVK